MIFAAYKHKIKEVRVGVTMCAITVYPMNLFQAAGLVRPYKTNQDPPTLSCGVLFKCDANATDDSKTVAQPTRRRDAFIA